VKFSAALEAESHFEDFWSHGTEARSNRGIRGRLVFCQEASVWSQETGWQAASRWVELPRLIESCCHNLPHMAPLDQRAVLVMKSRKNIWDLSDFECFATHSDLTEAPRFRIHNIECRVHYAVQNMPKARAIQLLPGNETFLAAATNDWWNLKDQLYSYCGMDPLSFKSIVGM
jgi:hypothetical protein